jgi:hypothetical protein
MYIIVVRNNGHFVVLESLSESEPIREPRKIEIGARFATVRAAMN